VWGLGRCRGESVIFVDGIVGFPLHVDVAHVFVVDGNDNITEIIVDELTVGWHGFQDFDEFDGGHGKLLGVALVWGGEVRASLGSEGPE
jgi:hypothetical protein